MKDLPFAKYDFWAYLSSGSLFLYIVDYVAASGVFDRPQWTVVQTIVVISAAYVVGHLVAGLSSVILERWIVGRVLGPPRETLFGKCKAPRFLQKLLPGYFQALPKQIQDAALARSAASGVGTPGEAMFWLAFVEAKNSKTAMDRIESFLNLYGFCRNIALVFLIAAPVLIMRFGLDAVPRQDLWLGLGSLVIGAGMMLRYLKFLRHFAVEVVTQYALGRGQPGK